MSPTSAAKQKWCKKRYSYLLEKLSVISNLRSLYEESLVKAKQHGGGKTGIQFLVIELGLLKDDTTEVRKILYDLGIPLNSRDLGYIKRSKNFQESPEDYKKEVILARQSGLANYWQEIDDTSRSIRSNRIKIRRNMKEANRSLEDSSRNIAKSNSGTATSGSRFRYYATVGGKEILFHSTWEQQVYESLLYSKIPFIFTNEEAFVLDLVVRKWRPDFIVGIDIIEVKGYPKAVASFYGEIFPAFLASSYTDIYRIWVYELKKPVVFSYFELLSQCKLIHDPYCPR